MFDKLEDLVDRLDTLNNQLTDPDIVSDQNKFRKLMKEQSELRRSKTVCLCLKKKMMKSFVKWRRKN